MTRKQITGICLGSWLLVGLLAVGIATNAGYIHAIDAPIVATVTHFRPAWLTAVLLVVTRFGNPPIVTGITIVLTLVFLARRRWYSAGRLALTVSLGSALNRLLKALFNRPRPFIADPSITPLVPAGGWSFPSGHANGTTLLYGTLIVLLWHAPVSRRTKLWGTVIGVAVILATGYSRIYVQVHYPTDVLAGWLAGVGVISLAWLVSGRTD